MMLSPVASQNARSIHLNGESSKALKSRIVDKRYSAYGSKETNTLDPIDSSSQFAKQNLHLTPKKWRNIPKCIVDCSDNMLGRIMFLEKRCKKIE